VKFLAKLGKFATETYSLLMEVYGDECLILKFSIDSKDLKREGERSKSMSNFKAMMIVFFYMQRVVHIDWVPEGQTVNHVYYKEVLTVLHEWVRRKRPEMWKKGSWILHHDNSCLLGRFWRSTRSPCWNIHPIHLT
jgi:hypothetical protein